MRRFYCNQIIEALKDLNNASDGGTHEFFVHSYSNNGFWEIGELCLDYVEKGFHVPSKIIYDSAPLLFTQATGVEFYEGLTRVVTSSTLAKPIYWHPIVSPIVFAVLVPLNELSNVIINLQTGSTSPLLFDRVRVNLHFLKNPLKIPSMFIYRY
jgi:hypothetical protein